jgi:hypothetical protein
MGINWSSAYEAGQAAKTAAAAAPVATTAAAAVPAATTPAAAPPSSDNSLVSDVEGLWQGLVGVSNDLTSFGGASASSGSAGVGYVGNVGVPYGANIIKVASTAGYQYTNTFVNSQSQTITVNIWNKAGPDGQANSGSALAPTDTTLTFTLPPGGSQVVAFMENTQVGWAEACSDLAASGAYATTWGECNFASSGSGYDMSAIMNSAGNNYNMAISSVEAPACTSDMTQNYWLTATEPIGNSDGSCFIAQSTATLTTVMGGTV